MFQDYINKVLMLAEYKQLDDGNWFASISGFDGVWASCETVEETRNELIEVLEEWLLLKFRDNEEIPFSEGTTLNFSISKKELV